MNRFWTSGWNQIEAGLEAKRLQELAKRSAIVLGTEETSAVIEQITILYRSLK